MNKKDYIAITCITENSTFQAIINKKHIVAIYENDKGTANILTTSSKYAFATTVPYEDLLIDLFNN